MQREREFWRTSDHEAPGAFSVDLLLQKTNEARVFQEAFARHRARFEAARTILELGGGQGWAACMVKATLGDEKVVLTSDIGEAAIASVPMWEATFRARLDGCYACPALDIPLGDEAVDLIFAFDAAHHFGAHRRTLAEIHRVLVPGGVCLYLHEPTAPAFLYRPAVARVNRRRASYGHDVVEDVIVGDQLLAVGRDLGFDAQRIFAPSTLTRGSKERAYYQVVSRLGRAQRFVPSAADFVFTKPSS